MPTDDLPELAIALAWHRGQLGAAFRTIDGRSVEIVHRGVWSHGYGPDFVDAMVVFDGRDLRTGAIELHLGSRGWLAHGHHLDPRYDPVVLHVALRDDGTPARTSAGAAVPLVLVDPDAVPPLPDNGIGPDVWNRFGGEACAADLAFAHPGVLREALWSLGDRRLAARTARLESLLTISAPGEVLWAELLDGLGFSANRGPMRSLAAAVPLAVVETSIAGRAAGERLDLARALLFGAAGFLPLSPTDAGFAGLEPGDTTRVEASWRTAGGPWRGQELAPTAWTRSRVRPANHPAARIAAAAALAVGAFGRGGVLVALVEAVRTEPDPARVLAELAAPPSSPGIGDDRAADIAASSLLPFTLALAGATGDADLAEAAARWWERLPAGSANAVTRRALRQVTGGASLGKLGARGAQGLIHLDTALCAPRRCFECPVAHRVIAAGMVEQGRAD